MFTINAIETSEIYGHGNRLVIWFSGCSLRCEGCINKHLWDKNSGRKVSRNELLNIINRHKDIVGVTYLGGEPLEQSKELLFLSKIIIKEGLDIVIFTGYNQNELLGWRKRLVNISSVVIYGRYDQKKRNTNLLLRGSENQEIVVNNDNLISYYKDEKRQVEVEITESSIKYLGFPEDFL